MKRWLILLALTLLLSAAWARAEDTYYTNNIDRYYHSDPDCDRPEDAAWYGGERIIYERACYRKYPISEEAAQAFEKAACPICVKRTEPVYLGQHMMEWEYDFAPWGIGERRSEWSDARLGSKEYRAEVTDTEERFQAYFEEIYDRDADEFVRRHPYPDAYAGRWANNADGVSYAIVDPSREILDAFEKQFGGGAWIVPAKYGYNEMKALQDAVFEMVDAWREGHPEFDILVSMCSLDEWGNCLDVGIYGDTWEEAMPVLDRELELPVWVCFQRQTSLLQFAEGAEF